MRHYLTKLKQLMSGRQWSGESVGVTVGGFGINVPMGRASNLPAVLRHGLDPADPTPLYNMDAPTLMRWFNGYAQTPEFMQHVLYGETVALFEGAMRPIVRGGLDVADLTIEFEATPYQVPIALQRHRDAMLDFFRHTGRSRRLPDGEWENNITARLCEFDPSTGHMVLQQARYTDQIATNLSVDTNSNHLPPGMLSIRRGFEPPHDGRLVPLHRSGLANSLGVAGVLFARDGQPLMRERSKHLGSINSQKIHCSVSGVYEIPPGTRLGERHGYPLLRHGIELEIRHELGLEPGEYRLFPIALSRELPRHGKPQLFFAILSDMPVTDLIARMQTADERHEFLNDPNFMFRIAPADHSTYSRYTYEGWAALHFATKFLQANQESLAFAPRR
ncbi:hypothetical protein MLD63_09810 [Paracoccus sp. TK19116]|uniref:Uncharacterized protein n=1 Tax=Paracoccus albicereus TaxID=2922394 RepID=A0ABT1MR01_9RHOB|nr:hypothetical protein [Paracoccus albicereus]MCQ0970718.1 hypothetical protein [Paracoccus albicereus]